MSRTPAGEQPRPAATVIVPAHNEEAVIGRLLGALQVGTPPNALRVIVVANGCADHTSEVVRATPGVELVELERGNKQEAMRAGASMTPNGPVVFVDADVVISRSDVLQLVDVLNEPGVLAAAPTRVLDLEGASPLVRSYYRVWSALPSVTEGLFGRGVIALSAPGRARVADLPKFLSDDLALSESFDIPERRVVTSAEVRIRGPRRAADLVRRRRRILAGVQEFDATTETRERTSVTTLVSIARQTPSRVPDIVVFAGITLLVRVLALRHGSSRTTWWRDESSRGG